MRAKVYKIDDESIKVITDDDEIKSIPKDRIDFSYRIGDIIRIVENDKEELYLPYEKSEKTNKKNNHHKKKAFIIVTICIVIIASTVAAIMVPKILDENRKKALNSQLDSCLLNGYKKIHPNSSYTMVEIGAIKQSLTKAPTKSDVRIFIGDQLSEEIEKDEYDMALSCYDTYKVDGYQEIVDQILSNKNVAEQTICVYKAEKNSEITETELEESKSSIIKTVALLTRLSNGYQEKINCYEKYKTDDSDSKISELKIKKNENDSYLESAKNDANNRNINNIRVHCSTNTIGGYTYTNCY